MINSLTIILLTVLTLANLFLLVISVYHWKNKKGTADKTGFAFMAILTIFNIAFTIGGALW